jgi:uncharacterized protein YkwD
MTRAALLALLLTVAPLLGGCPGGSESLGETPAETNPGSAGPTTTPGPTTTAGEFVHCRVPTDEDAWASEVLQYVNDERVSRGLPALKPDAGLAEQADVHACAMIDYNFFDHTNPVTGSTPADRFAASGFKGYTCGENIAAGQLTPAQVVTEWMNSPGHRSNILSADFTHLGVGIRQGGRYGIYWVQLFGGLPKGGGQESIRITSGRERSR